MIWHLWVSVQLILEMVPISSSGHLFLFETFIQKVRGHLITFPLFDQHKRDDFFHLIQFPTIVLIAVYFFKQWFFLLRNAWRCRAIILKIMMLGAATDAISALWYLGIVQYQLITIPLWLGFGVTACLLFSLRWCAEKKRKWDLQSALIIGCAQGIALLPGISRYASTVVIASWLGISKRRCIEISWLIEMPLFGAAFLKSLLFEYQDFIWSEIFSVTYGAAIACSSIIAYIVMKKIIQLYEKNKWYYIGLYMIFPFIVSCFI